MVVGVYHFQTIEKENQRLQYIYNIIQIAMTFFIAGSGIFAVRQYYKYCKSEEKRFQTEYVQKAIDLSGFYKDSILTKYRAILYVYNKSGIINILEKIKKKDMKFFEMRELEELLKTEDRNRLKEIQNSEVFLSSIRKANIIYGFNHTMQNENTMMGEYDQEAIIAIFSDMINELLNDLEFFASHFVHETADNHVVFHQLHITYLQIVHILYYSIAKENRSLINKYYQNIIDLYSNWYEKSEAIHNCLTSTCVEECRGQIVERSQNGKSKK